MSTLQKRELKKEIGHLGFNDMLFKFWITKLPDGRTYDFGLVDDDGNEIKRTTRTLKDEIIKLLTTKRCLLYKTQN